MRKIGVLIIVIAAMAMVPAVSWAGVTGTAHDLSSVVSTPSGQVCVVCHTPHNALSTLVPLWNHATTTATFTLYDSASLDATPGEPAGVSKACLSCHDGTVALDSYGGGTGTITITGAALLGTGLTDDHPISFTYDAALATTDGGLVSPSGGTVGTNNLPLYGDKLECGSCHNVHDDTNNPFLRMSNASSAMCLNCHNK